MDILNSCKSSTERIDFLIESILVIILNYGIIVNMVSPVVVIFCRHIDTHKQPFSSIYYWNGYMDLLLALQSCGAKAYFATDHDNYLGDGVFAEAFTATKKVPVDQLEKVLNVRADVVYDKGGFNSVDDVAILNPKSVYSIASDKSKTYEYFGHLQPATIICNSLDEAIAAINTIRSRRVVFKELKSNGGKGVNIVSRAQAAKTAATLEYPQIVQEFIDTSVGITGLCNGIHDLRIEIGGGEIWGGLVRTPKAGELRANVAMGGTERHINPKEIPDSARQIAIEIDGLFASYPRHYSIDLANTKDGFKLIELNSKPGLSPVSLGRQAQHVTESLAKYLYKLAIHNIKD